MKQHSSSAKQIAHADMPRALADSGEKNMTAKPFCCAQLWVFVFGFLCVTLSEAGHDKTDLDFGRSSLPIRE